MFNCLLSSGENFVNSEGCFNYKPFSSILENNISVFLKITNLPRGILRMTLAATTTGTYNRLCLMASRCGSLFFNSVVTITALALLTVDIFVVKALGSHAHIGGFDLCSSHR